MKCYFSEDVTSPWRATPIWLGLILPRCCATERRILEGDWEGWVLCPGACQPWRCGVPVSAALCLAVLSAADPLPQNATAPRLLPLLSRSPAWTQAGFGLCQGMAQHKSNCRTLSPIGKGSTASSKSSLSPLRCLSLASCHLVEGETQRSSHRQVRWRGPWGRKLRLPVPCHHQQSDMEWVKLLVTPMPDFKLSSDTEALEHIKKQGKLSLL